MTNHLLDNEDLYEAQIKEQQQKQQKKLEKLERLNRKKNLIHEIKSTIEQAKVNSNSQEFDLPHYKIGSIEWALFILQAKENSNILEIKKNYLQLAQQFHPDKNNGETTKEMKDLNKAFEIIKKFKTQSR